MAFYASGLATSAHLLISLNHRIRPLNHLIISSNLALAFALALALTLCCLMMVMAVVMVMVHREHTVIAFCTGILRLYCHSILS